LLASTRRHRRHDLGIWMAVELVACSRRLPSLAACRHLSALHLTDLEQGR